MIAALALVAVMAGASGAGSAVQVDPLELGAPEVSAAASPSEVRLGQQITIVVTAVYGAGVEVNLPDPLFPAGAPLEVAHRESSDQVRTDGRRSREWQIKTYAWELGEFDIPPIQVTFTAGGKAAVVPTNSIPIRVQGVLGDADDPKLMRAMATPVPLWRRTWMLVWVAGGVVAAILALVALWRRRRARKKKAARAAPIRFAESPLAEASAQESAADDDAGDGDPQRDVAPVAPPPPAPKAAPIVRARRKLDRIAEEALARLRALEQSGRLDSDRRGAYRDMVSIIRDYLGARFDVDAQELTTRELCEALMFRSGEAAGLVRAWLAACDLVKYAGLGATGDEVRSVLDGACWLVDQTTPGGSAQGAARA